MRLDGHLRPRESGLRLVQGDVAGMRRESRESASYLGPVEHLVPQVPFPARTQAARNCEAVRRPDEQPAREPVDLALGIGGELVPQLVGTQQQRHIRRVLEVGLPDDARTAVAGSFVVGGSELLQPEHPLPASREMVGGGAAHAAEPDHDDVVTPVRSPGGLPLDPRHLGVDHRLGVHGGGVPGAAVVDGDGVADLGRRGQPRVGDAAPDGGRIRRAGDVADAARRRCRPAPCRARRRSGRRRRCCATASSARAPSPSAALPTKSLLAILTAKSRPAAAGWCSAVMSVPQGR